MRDPFHDVDAVTRQGADLSGVIGEEPYTGKTQVAQHPHRGKIDAFVIVEPQLLVGIDGIKAAVLQGVGAQFVDETNAAPFLRQV